MKFNIPRILLILLTISISFTGNSQSVQEPVRPTVTGVAHAAFFTRDVATNRKFFRDYLGFGEPFSLMTTDGKELALTFIKINDRQYIEVFPERSQGGNRMYHFAIETSDAEAMRKYLASKGIKVPEKTPKGRSGNFNFFVTDPNGTICEIVQYEKNSMSGMNLGREMPETRISTRMSHVGFMVPDLDKALEFYCGILGFRETWRGSRDGKNTTWVNLQVPDGNDYVELMLYDKTPSEANMGSMNHVCLEVDDVSLAESKLAKRPLPEGCKTPTPMKTGINMKRQVNCYDIDGTRIEIMESKTVDGQPVPSSTAPPLKFSL